MHAPSRQIPMAAVVAWGAAVVEIASVLFVLWLVANPIRSSDVDGQLQGALVVLVVGVSVGIGGAILVWRVPASAVGWLMFAAGVGTTVWGVGIAYPAWTYAMSGPTPLATALAWLGRPAAQFGLAMIGGVLLLFPSGRPPEPRWWPIVWSGAALAACYVLQAAFAPGPMSDQYPVPNPLGFGPVGTLTSTLAAAKGVAIPLFALAVVVSQGVRYRAGSSIERQQIKWFVVACAVFASTGTGASLAPDARSSAALWLLATGLLALLPITIVAAILRYHLYDIDHLVSRTLSWALVTGILVVLFAGTVVALQAILTGFTQGQTMAVAASTLFAFALFQPLRRRVQRAVDRHFDRGRYDAQRTADAFAERLRSDMAIDSVTADLEGTVDVAVRPAVHGLWLREIHR